MTDECSFGTDATPSARDSSKTVHEIVEQHGRYVWRALRHLGVSEADLEDACQEVFVVVHRKLGEFGGRAALRTWLYGIAIRVAADHRKRHRRRREEPLSSEPPAHSSPAFHAHARTEARRTLSQLLDVLDDDKRKVVVLHELEGMTINEVAALVGCPVQTAYYRLYAARERLARAAAL